MATAGRRPKEELNRYIPMIIQKLGQARPIDIKRYFDTRIKPATGFTVDYRTIGRYCEKLVDQGILIKNIMINNIDAVKKDGRRHWTLTFYRTVPKQTEVVYVEKRV